jgi:hypothetical protein
MSSRRSVNRKAIRFSCPPKNQDRHIARKSVASQFVARTVRLMTSAWVIPA